MKIPKYVRNAIIKTTDYYTKGLKYELIVRRWLKERNLLNYEDEFIKYSKNKVPENFIEKLEKDISNINISKIHYRQKRLTDKNLYEYSKAYKRVQNFCYKNKNAINDTVKNKIFKEIRMYYDFSKIEPLYIDKLKSINYNSLFNIYISKKEN